MTPAVLNPAQQRVSDHGLLQSGFSVVLQMPTGSGKTWLARQAIEESLKRGLRAVYLSPLRALADELAGRWQDDFGEVPVGVFTGDYGRPGRSYPVPYADAQVLIMTPERLDACTRRWRSHWSWIPQVDWLVVDEIHLLGDGNRGSRLEGTISRFRRLNPFCRVLGLSATLGNREELADWLDGVELDSDWRPVPLEWKVVRYRKPEEKPSLLAREVDRIHRDGGQSLVFVQSRRRSEQVASWLREQGLGARHHHAGLGHDQRRRVERDFRENSTDILVATATLEMGLNLPARQVVLYDLQGFDGVGFEPLQVNTVWQRAGRAGRPGFDLAGEAVLMAPSWDRVVDRYPQGRFEPIRSGLARPQHLAEQVLAEVASGLARTVPQLERVMDSSLANRQGQRLKVEETVREMLDAGMLREDEGEARTILQATRLGRIACRHQLQPATVLRLRLFLETYQAFTDFDLLLVIASTSDCAPLLPVDYEELERLSDELARQPSRLFQNPIQDSSLLEVGGKRLLAALKTSLALWRWTVLGDAELVAEEDGCYPFEVARLVESADRLLLAAASIRRLIDEPHPPEDDEEPAPKSECLLRIELLRQKIINGIDGPAAHLTLVEGIGPSWARKLAGNGISDLEALGSADPAHLATFRGLSEKRAAKWIEAAKDAQSCVPSFVEAKHLPTLPPDTDLSVDPYRLRRALDLKVESANDNTWMVSGGSEPRRVERQESQLHCSCPDHAKGHVCKHILSVQLAMGELIIDHLKDQLGEDYLPGGYLDLFNLWFQR